MLLALYAVALVLLAGLVVWRAVSRWWHGVVVAVLWVPLFPFVSRWLTGDASRYLPRSAFSDGPAGEDEVVLTSALSTVLVSVTLAAALLWLARLLWQLFRRAPARK
jgi:Kef-type K+ transport system membrane component KefB